MSIPQQFIQDAINLRSELDNQQQAAHGELAKRSDIFKAHIDKWTAGGVILTGDAGEASRKALVDAAFGEGNNPRKSEWDGLMRYSDQWAAMDAVGAALVADEEVKVRDRWTGIVRAARLTKKNSGIVPDVNTAVSQCRPAVKSDAEKAIEKHKSLVGQVKALEKYYPGAASIAAQLEAIAFTAPATAVAPAPAPAAQPATPATPATPAQPVANTGFDVSDLMAQLGPALAAMVDQAVKKQQ